MYRQVIVEFSSVLCVPCKSPPKSIYINFLFSPAVNQSNYKLFRMRQQIAELSLELYLDPLQREEIFERTVYLYLATRLWRGAKSLMPTSLVR